METFATTPRVDVFFCEYTDDLLGRSLAMDVRVRDEQATLADFLSAQSELAEQRLDDCRGCDGCCRERAPLIAADLPALLQLLPPAAFPAHAVVAAFGRLDVEDGVTDITLRRDGSGACAQLDQQGHFCTRWPQRAFVCRSHFCLPRTARLELLREQVVNSGENELTRLILAEEATGAPPLTERPLAQLVAAADYPAGALSNAAGYADIRIRDCVDDELWNLLRQE